MATISGNVIFDRDRSATVSSGDSGLENIPVVLQNLSTAERLTVLTDINGNYMFLNVPNGEYRIVESYGTPGGVPTPGNFSTAVAGSVPEGVNPPISVAPNPPTGSTNLDSVTPDTLLVTVSGSDLSNQNFLNGPVIYTPIQEILDPCAIISGNNLIDVADDGTFGTFPQGTPANTGAPTEPYPEVTPDFSYVLPNPAIFAPLGGEYTVQNIMNNSMSAEIGAWWRIADHSIGNETGRMMIVNGFNPGAVFFRAVVNVQPGTNYLFTSWILNLFKVTGYPDPELGVRVLDQNGGVLYSATLGTLIPVNVNAPEWKQIGSVINSQNNNSLTVEFLSEGPEVIGNDYAIDDVSLNEILIPEFVPIKTVDSTTANVGETVTYTVTLTNTCSSPLTDLFFQDTVPNGLSFVPGSVIVNGITAPDADPNVGFSLPDVPGGENVTVVFQALVTEVPVPNPALNSATINYAYTPVEGGIPGEYEVISNEVPVTVATSADISVVKSAQPSPVEPGAELTYYITVSNAGPSPAVNILLTDDIPSELINAEFSADGGITFLPWTGTYMLGTLETGGIQTILIRGNLSSSADGDIVNTAVVSSDTPDPNPDDNTSTVVTPVIPVENSADLSIIKTSAPNPVQPGGMLNYTLTILNAGPSPAVNTILTDDVPSVLANVEYSLDGGLTWRTWTGTLNLGTLLAGSSINVRIRGTVSESVSGSIVNTAMVSSNTPDPDLSNNSYTNVTEIASEAYADISVTKSGQPATVTPGGILTYTITVTNHGPDDAENVFLYDEVPPELMGVQFSLDGGATWNLWNNPLILGSIPSGQSITIQIRGIVTSAACGSIFNTAVVKSDTRDQEPSNNTSSVNTPVETGAGADLSIRKTACPNPVIRGNMLKYTITVSNAGPENAEQVVVRDNLPNELNRPVYSLDGGQTYHPWTGSLDLGNLAPYSSVSIIISGMVSECAKNCIKNTALVSSVIPDPDLSNNRDFVTVKICDCCTR